MIAAAVDSILIGATCYARIRNPANLGQVWNVSAQAFANQSSVSLANATVAGTVDSWGFFTASEPTGFSPTLIAPVTIHERAGGSAAATDPTAAVTVTHGELVADGSAQAVRDAMKLSPSAGAAGADSVDEKLDTIDSAGTVSPFNVDADHTWKFDSRNQTTAGNYITESVGFDALLCMDFDEPLPHLSAIHAINTTSISPTAGAEPVLGTAAISANKRKVNLPADCTSADPGTYTIIIKITTSDSQVFSRKGRLVLQ